ncbi:MAG: hypothetical protein NXH95_00740 [Pseudomonadaceae bacterium]|nr:hypothetical protein [Pseudomonadaceae bacterium]
MFTDKITILIAQVKNGGYLVESNDLPELNIFVRDEANLKTAIPAAIKYLYKHNRNINVQVSMQGPALDIPRPDGRASSRRYVELRSAA